MRNWPLFPVLALTLALAACAPAATPAPDALRVAASIYPVAYLAERVGGDVVDVTRLIPDGAEAHDFEPSPSHLRTLADADLLVMNGLGLEPWVERAQASLGADAPASVALAGELDDEHVDDDHADDEHADDEHADDEHADDEHADDEHADDEHADDEHADDEHADDEHADDEHADDEHADDDHGHDHGGVDPHVWLDPLEAIAMTERLRDALTSAAPEHAEAFAANAAALTADLEALHAEFTAGLADCRLRVFVTSHAAYGHLAERYGLEQRSIAGLTTEGEPSAAHLADLTDLMRAQGIGLVLVEPLHEGGEADVLAAETGAALRTVHPLESVTGAERAAYGDYLGLMRDNLAALRAALGCR
jgi:zinc transport system substrate-binding protein